MEHKVLLALERDDKTSLSTILSFIYCAFKITIKVLCINGLVMLKITSVVSTIQHGVVSTIQYVTFVGWLSGH
jgi:hypothetical protein